MRKCSYNSDCATNGHCDDGNYWKSIHW
jgi:hypothetical protein